MTGSALFARMISFDYGGSERNQLMRQVWSVTPWMLNIFTGPSDGDLRREMADWCRERYGAEARPIHGQHGRWQFGSATIHGWDWIGFASRGDMEAFKRQYGGTEDQV